MKKWTASEWSLFVLACTIPFALLLSFLSRMLGLTSTPEGSALLADVLKVISGGVFGVIAGMRIKDMS